MKMTYYTVTKPGLSAAFAWDGSNMKQLKGGAWVDSTQTPRTLELNHGAAVKRTTKAIAEQVL